MSVYFFYDFFIKLPNTGFHNNCNNYGMHVFFIKITMLAHGRWLSPGTPASSTTKTGRHDIAEILMKVALNTKNQSINHVLFMGVNEHGLQENIHIHMLANVCFL